jgi:PAS domain S-box-containing protein
MTTTSSNLAPDKTPAEQNQALIQQRIERLQTQADLALTVFRQLTGLSIFVLDFDGNILSFNEGARITFGYAPDKVIGRRHIDLFFPPEFTAKGQLKQAIAAALSELSYGYDGDMLRINNQRFSAHALLTLTQDLDGRMVGFILAVQDITERHQAQLRFERLNGELVQRLVERTLALRNSEAHFRSVIETASDAILSLGGADGRVTAWNPAAQAMFGYSAAEAIGRVLHELLVPVRFRAAAAVGMAHFIRNGEGAVVGKTTEMLALRRDGTEFPVALSISAMLSDGAWQATGIARDITARTQAEHALQANLAEKEVMMREIHHRVKNNLQMMSALLELQSGYMHDEQARNCAKENQLRIQSMALIHEQLYHNSNLSQIDFAVYLRSLVDNLRAQFSERSSEVKLQISTCACTLPVDCAIPMGLVLNELVTNVFKHAFPKSKSGELRINLQCDGENQMVLEVTDDGVGLPPELDLQHSQTFGLRLLKLMVEEQLHGQLAVESNHGTRVRCAIGVKNESKNICG